MTTTKNAIAVIVFSAIMGLALFKNHQSNRETQEGLKTIDNRLSNLEKAPKFFPQQTIKNVPRHALDDQGASHPKPLSSLNVESLGNIKVEWVALNPRKNTPKPLRILDKHRNNWQETKVRLTLSESQLRLLKGKYLKVEVLDAEALLPTVSQTILIGNNPQEETSLIDHSEKTSDHYHLQVKIGDKLLFKELIVENRKFTR